jgi:hypothetical protein
LTGLDGTGEGEAEIYPDRVLNELGRKATAAMRKPPWLMVTCPLPPLDPVSVTKPATELEHRCLSPPPTAWAAFIGGELRLLEPPKQLYRFAEAHDRSDDTAGPTVDRPQPTEASKSLPILRGTEISNPSPFRRGLAKGGYPQLKV